MKRSLTSFCLGLLWKQHWYTLEAWEIPALLQHERHLDIQQCQQTIYFGICPNSLVLFVVLHVTQATSSSLQTEYDTLQSLAVCLRNYNWHYSNRIIINHVCFHCNCVTKCSVFTQGNTFVDSSKLQHTFPCTFPSLFSGSDTPGHLVL